MHAGAAPAACLTRSYTLQWQTTGICLVPEQPSPQPLQSSGPLTVGPNGQYPRYRVLPCTESKMTRRFAGIARSLNSRPHRGSAQPGPSLLDRTGGTLGSHLAACTCHSDQDCCSAAPGTMSPGSTWPQLHSLGTMSTYPAAVLLGESAKLPAQLGSCREPRRQGESPGWLRCHMRLFPSGNPQLSGVPDSAGWSRLQGASLGCLPQVAWVVVGCFGYAHEGHWGRVGHWWLGLCRPRLHSLTDSDAAHSQRDHRGGAGHTAGSRRNLAND